MKTDLIVVGGGFAGSLLAAIAARLGMRTTLVERRREPAFAVGESSTPAGNMILTALADRFDLPEVRPLARYGAWKQQHAGLDVGAKRGFSYFHHEIDGHWRQKPDHANELLVAASADPEACDTHWYRQDVDAFLLGQAAEAGVTVMTGTEARDVRRLEAGWRVITDAGAQLEAAVLVDATGSSVFSRDALGIRPGEPLTTCTSAAFTHVEGLEPWEVHAGLDTTDHPFPCDRSALHHVGPSGWMWELGFDSGITSVGVVQVGTDAPVPETWVRPFKRLAERYGGARLARVPGRVVRTGRLQRIASAAGGLRWALLPYAAGFVDPLHSTGIAHSLAGVERLAGVLATGDVDFTAYGRSVLAELRHLDGMVSACYRALPDFGAFSASTLLYFAASIRYERERMEAGNRSPGLFLGADQEDLQRLVREAQDRAGPEDYGRWVEEAVRPFDPSGALRPAVPNMYPHTAPRGW